MRTTAARKWSLECFPVIDKSKHGKLCPFYDHKVTVKQLPVAEYIPAQHGHIQSRVANPNLEGRIKFPLGNHCKHLPTSFRWVRCGHGRLGHVLKGYYLVLVLYLSMCRINIVAFDFLGHGDSPRPNQPELYTADEVSIYV